MHNLPAFQGADEHDVFKAWSTDWQRLAPVWAILQLGKLRTVWYGPRLGEIEEVILYTRKGHFYDGTPEWLDDAEYCCLRVRNADGNLETLHMLKGVE